MQVSTSVQRWIVVLTALTIVLIGGVVTSAQASDPIVRYFGFSGDVTIDGVPVEPGTVIVAMVDDEEVGRTTVNQAGAWILDVVMSDLNPDSCAVTFVVDGLRAPEEWPEEGFCGELRLRLALFTDGQERDSASRSTASPGENNQVEAESSRPWRGGRGERLSWRVLNRMTAIKCRRTTKAAGTLMSHGKSSGRRLPAPGPAAYLSIRNPRTGLAR